MDWLVKIGGSLFPENAAELLKSLEGTGVAVVCGGGDFADRVRYYDRISGFSESAAHDSAILCMDITGRLLSDLCESAVPVRTLGECREVVGSGLTPVILPSELLRFTDPVEHSWRVTSDSLSLIIAHMLGAKLLIATDVDGIYTERPPASDAKLINEISAKNLLSFGETSVDEALPELLIKLKTDCYVANGKFPERVLSILRAGASEVICTVIRGD
ncbi:delta 1-pyrroline-5-carboxylate synthetase [Methanothermobacter marburgensis]|uniref:Predicted amino acid kinase n=1 Tax=Methanothermobacter marburgensis (strain ATCC BAA-927 / DSM 2133 / JCM 14651 / NBRC 100331 / OCM 82 / Marburg) TaxID=79929 RepID=D9PUI6_METTM|nr:delta 1-pyrroline-5-carboxylate synthetase [Methanothermobacter marburgensis]ADL57884.1 predicted amino acid kinase [Methanothermobacter marburgensis str. Marburg]WBF10088.1 delta 1-pyrroline-5-carboxylate synthetase [Methanothermobacter marburgensis]